MDPTIEVTIPQSQLESEPTENDSETEQAISDVSTVADEILVEVKECRNRQEQIQADLARLQSEAEAVRANPSPELLTEIRNLREENRSLNAELKTLLENLKSSTPSVSPITEPEIAPKVIDPANESTPDETSPKKKKRYRI